MQRIEYCGTCRFFILEHVCARFPQQVEKLALHWCGEWRLTENRDLLCLFEGRETCPAREAQPGFRLKHSGLIWPSSPARPAIHTECLLAKGHEGKHTDGIEEW